MKADTTKLFKLCERLNFGSSLRQSFQALVYTLLVRKSQSLRSILVRVSRGMTVTLNVSLTEILGNKRLLVGLFTMLIIAPCAGGLFKIFNASTVMSEAWYSPNEYYGNYRYLLMGIRGNLFVLFSILGTFLLFPVKYKVSYFLGAPLGYVVAEIVKKCYAASNEEFNSIAPLPSVVLCICLIIGFLLSVDYLLYRKYHLKDGTIARIVGLIKTPGIDAQTKLTLLEQQTLELENFNQRY